MADSPQAGGWRLTVALALIAASVPVATGVHDCQSRKSQVELARIEEDFKIKTAYLDRATDSRPAEMRQVVLRFLLATTKDEEVKGWANDELKRVDAQRADTEKLERLKAEVAGTAAARDRARANARAAKAGEETAHAKAALAEAEKRLSALEHERDELKAKAASAAVTLAPASATATVVPLGVDLRGGARLEASVGGDTGAPSKRKPSQ